MYKNLTKTFNPQKLGGREVWNFLDYPPALRIEHVWRQKHANVASCETYRYAVCGEDHKKLVREVLDGGPWPH